MSRLLSILTIVVFIAACSAPKTDEKSSGIVNDVAKARIDSTLKAMVDSEKIAGVSALIVEKGQEVYFNAFGNADREASKPFDRKTIVRIYSMTKPVTGVALMQLYEKGLFQLDDPLSKYLPEYADTKVWNGVDKKGKPILVAPKRPILVRDITRHTAGFAGGGDTTLLGKMVREANVLDKNNTLAQMSVKLAKLPLAFSPGDQWAYGICVDVQAALVEKLSGKPFDQYVKENILDPLKMNETRYVAVDKSRFAAVYQKAEDGKLNRVPDSLILVGSINDQDWPLKPGGFGLTSTVDDYMRFARMLVGNGTFDGATILKPETVKLMATNQLSDSVTQRMWLPSKGQVGFGIDFAVRLRPPVDENEKAGTVGEFFWDGAASTLFWVDPTNEITAVLFVQVFPFSNPLHKAYRDAIYGIPKPASNVATGQ
jgi:CubicO group peptidase (beta-lactamase class C family)